jgi:hypothetical protein
MLRIERLWGRRRRALGVNETSTRWHRRLQGWRGEEGEGDQAMNGGGSSDESRERNRLKSTCRWRRLQWGGEHGRAVDPPALQSG